MAAKQAILSRATCSSVFPTRPVAIRCWPRSVSPMIVRLLANIVLH